LALLIEASDPANSAHARVAGAAALHPVYSRQTEQHCEPLPSTMSQEGQMFSRAAHMAVTALVLSVSQGAAQQTISAGDSLAILSAVERWEEAWRTHDPILASQDYSDDADWTNAFGMRRFGRAAIQELIEEVFRLGFVMAGETEYEYHDFMVLRPDVVLLRSRAIRTGQQLPDGTVEEPRRTNHLRTFVRRTGDWLIVSHLIGDERTPGQPR
jgi:uncharacterized protein (TIGR02246 family)